MDKIELLYAVELIEDIPGTKFCNGMIGTVVECLSHEAFLVEFTDTEGDDLLVDCFHASQLKLDVSQSDKERTGSDGLPMVTAGKLPFA